MHESPRIRRLRSDLTAMERLRDESSVLWFRASGKPVQQYLIEFRGKSLARLRGRIAVAELHQVEIKLGAAYPRTMPEIRWLSPIYHPNISEIGMVCLGGYGTHWVPSLNLDELCGMLWDMARYQNYDVRSPYNRDAALWVANQTAFSFPIDLRPLRNLRAAVGRVEFAHPEPPPIELDPVAPPDPAHSADAVGSKAGRYAEFVRNFASNLRSSTPLGPSETAEPDLDRLIILDGPGHERDGLSSDPDRPALSPRLRAADEEIVFIE